MLLNIGFYICYFLYKEELSYTFFLREKNLILYYNISYLFSISLWGVILHKRNVRVEEILDKVFKTLLTQFIILFVTISITNNLSELNLKYSITLFIIAFWVSTTWRILMRQIIKNERLKKKNIRNIIILGSGNVAKEVYNKIVLNIHNSYNLLGCFDDRKEIQIDKELVIGNINDSIEFLQNNHVDEIFCALPAGDDRKAIPILNYAENNLIRFYFVPDFKRFLSKKVNLQFISDIPVVSLREEPLEYFPNRFIKRAFDIIVASIFLFTVFPVLLLFIGLAIRIESNGSIFFKQKRTGKKGEDFYCYKFRSMNQNNDADEKQATKNDDRITKIGSFLRKTSLDELPQFWNVLIGDMSIVGPRPHMLKHTDKYSELIDKYMLRHLALPGITGWAQVNGCRGETKDIREMERRVKLDVWYLENWTFWLDLKIMFQTAYLAITGDEKAY